MAAVTPGTAAHRPSGGNLVSHPTPVTSIPGSGRPGFPSPPSAPPTTVNGLPRAHLAWERGQAVCRNPGYPAATGRPGVRADRSARLALMPPRAAHGGAPGSPAVALHNG